MKTPLISAALVVLAPAPLLAQFGPPQNLLITALEIHDAIAEDIDADGDLDILIGRTDGIYVLPNQGGASFAAPQQLLSASAPSGLNLLDVDADGVRDLLFSSAGQLRVALGTGSTTFAQPSIIGPISPYGYTVGDLDGDGLPDIVGPSFSPAGADQVYTNLGGGQFAGSSPFPGYVQTTTDVVLHDFDGDGDVDVIAMTLALNEAVALENQGGSFVASPSGISDHFLTLADVDGDGFQDIVGIDYWAPGSNWYRHSGGLQFQTQAALAQSVIGNSRAAAADFNDDGFLDVACGSDLTHDAVYNLGGPSGIFGPETLLASFGVSPRNVRAADLDGDLDLDLFCVAPVAGALVWFENLHTVGEIYCAPTATSVSSGAQLEATGSSEASANALAFTGRAFPPGGAVLLLTGTARGLWTPPVSAGPLCLGGNLGRFNGPGQLGFGDAAGNVRFFPDLTATPTSSGATSVLAGETRQFQAWFRDANPPFLTNFSGAIEVTFR